MAKNFLSLVKHVALHTQGVVRIPNRINLKKSMSRHIIDKLLRTKDEKSQRQGERNDTLPRGEKQFAHTSSWINVQSIPLSEKVNPQSSHTVLFHLHNIWNENITEVENRLVVFRTSMGSWL